MQNLLLALRNIGRNRRRSVVTILAVAVSSGGLALFGGYSAWTFLAVEEQTVQTYGHIQVYKKGYYEKGTGNPAAYAIEDYDKIKRLITQDPVIAPTLQLVTGEILFNGMVTATKPQTASTFAGLGVFPSEDLKLALWNPYGICNNRALPINARFFGGPPELSDDDVNGVSLGIGLARVLQITIGPDGRPKTVAADSAPAPPPKAPGNAPGADSVDLNFLTSQSGPKEAEPADKITLDLLVSPPTGGMPNATTVNLRKVIPRATKETEDTLMKLHIKQASSLLFPDQPIHVTAVVLLLKNTADTDLVLQRLDTLIRDQKLDLETRRWEEIRPFFPRMKRMVQLIFDFVFVLLVSMVAFLIYNTQSAGIIERLGEIGTLRAIGVTRMGIWKMLVTEGLLLGVLGAAVGSAIAVLGDWAFQMMNILYIPPSVSFYAKLEVLVVRDPMVLIQSVVGALLCSVISSALPARKAARLPIVEALRHC